MPWPPGMVWMSLVAVLGAAATPAELGSLRAIFRDHAAFVLRVARRLGVPPRDLEDVGQEVFLVVHRTLARWDGVSPMRSWLFGITRRVVADYRRRAYVRREELADAEGPPETSVDSGERERVEQQAARSLLDHGLAALDEDQRAVFVLFELEEVPMAEVARAVDCPLQTAYSRLYRAREIVRDAVVARAKQEAP